jgi:hypothetical protein
MFNVPCTVGWVDFGLFLHFQQKYPSDLLHTPTKSTENSKKKILPSELFIIGHDFLGHSLYKDPIFFHNMDFMDTKRRRILRRFQKYKLNLVTKCT